MQTPLNNFFSVISTKLSIVDELSNLYGRALANQFNSLDFWYLGENKVSQILAFFLNPRSSHGHDDLYLKLFIKHFGISFAYSDFRKVEVSVEKRIVNNRRLDILINYNSGEKVIGIENKIYENTADQFMQVQDYIEYLQSISKDFYLLLYLAPKSKVIPKHSITEENREKYINLGTLQCINYEDHLITLIHEFAIHSENDRVRSFLLDFEKKLRKNYMGEQSLDDSKAVADYILESEQNIGIAFKVGSAIAKVKGDLKASLLEQLTDLADELDITFDKEKGRFTLPELPANNVTISYEMGGLLYGLTRLVEDKNKPRIPEVENLFDEKFSVSAWWPMYRLLYENIDIRSEFWKDVKNGTVKKKIKQFIVTIRNSGLRSIT